MERLFTELESMCCNAGRLPMERSTGSVTATATS